VTNHDLGAIARRWHELEAAGIPLEPLEYRVGIDSSRAGRGLTIRGGYGNWKSEIRELKDGRFGYILPLFIRRDCPGKTIIRDIWIATPWPAGIIDLLEDPRDEGKHPRWYTLPGDTHRFFRESVLNHRFCRVLTPGSFCNGVLLGLGYRPPDVYKNHQLIEVTLGILDQWDNEIIRKFSMRLSWLAARPKQLLHGGRGPLLSRRDVPQYTDSWVASLVAMDEERKKAAEAARQQAAVGGKQLASKPG
jgi:hypothetical protein